MLSRPCCWTWKPPGRAPTGGPSSPTWRDVDRPSLVVVTAAGGPRVAGLPYLASLRLGVACRGWRWQRSRLTQVPMGLTLEVRVLKSRSDTGVQHLVIDCPFLRRSGGPEDALPLDSALPNHGGSSDAALVVGTAAGDLRAAS